MTEEAKFDAYAEDYDAALAEGLSVSGEDKDYFAHGRIAWLTKYLESQRIKIGSVLDYSCGTGTATPYFFDVMKAKRLVGVDISPKSIEVARRDHQSERTQFSSFDEYTPSQEIDLAFCNGVFHHIPRADRAASLDYIQRSMKPDALFAFWENNPWNPGTRYVMRRCPFDADAITLTPPEARRMLSAAGFEIVSTNFLFIFPRILAPLRRLEPLAARLPFGAQYQVLCRKK